MGPNTDNREIMKELALNGMDVARFNFSHGDHAEHKHRLEILESVREELGIPIAIAIALHNIPEGIAVAVPILYATGSRKKALLYSLLSGLAEPAGALIGFFFLLPFLTPVLLAVLFAVVAGVMIYISFDELLPMAETYGKHHIALAGVLGGMLFIGAGLEFL